MSLSMGSQDLSPSRYVRAIQKVTDIVRSRQDGQTALIVYDADAYTVAPLTDDTDTIENLLRTFPPSENIKPAWEDDFKKWLSELSAANQKTNQSNSNPEPKPETNPEP